MKNAKNHLNTVNGLGKFIKIEVVIKTEEQDKNAKNLLDELITIMNITNNTVIDVGYRELLLKKSK